MIVECVSQCTDRVTQCFLAALPIAPYLPEQLPAADYFTGLFGETQKHLGRLGGQVPRSVLTRNLTLQRPDQQFSQPEAVVQVLIHTDSPL